MQQISERVQALAASQTLAMSQKSAELRAQGIDVINMSVGEPDFNTPEHIKEAAEKAIKDNFTFYPPVPGYLSLRQAIADKLQRENGLNFEPAQIVVGNGAKHALSNLLLATINPGDEVIVPTPAWVSYTELVKLAGGINVLVPCTIDNDFKLSAEILEAAITERTRAIILCTPSNPTGSVYTEKELRALVDVLARYPQIMVIADEIYEHILYSEEAFISLGTFSEIADRTVIINGVSKAYAMTGWRIGYCAAPLHIAKACSKLQGQTTAGVSTIAQKAAEAAYNGSQECVSQMRKAFQRRRDLIVELAKQIPGMRINKPEGAFYLFPEISSYFGRSNGDKTINTSTDLAMYLLEEAHVACVAGDAFEAPDYIRFSYATSDENIKEAFTRVAQALAKLQ